ncbi:MAG: hypothetical protein KC506_03740 [Nanoarchaeota archaeon]|nr:hypothetical protein [Nanoarchaeota archaeon]
MAQTKIRDNQVEKRISQRYPAKRFFGEDEALARDLLASTRYREIADKLVNKDIPIREVHQWRDYIAPMTSFESQPVGEFYIDPHLPNRRIRDIPEIEELKKYNLRFKDPYENQDEKDTERIEPIYIVGKDPETNGAIQIRKQKAPKTGIFWNKLDTLRDFLNLSRISEPQVRIW